GDFQKAVGVEGEGLFDDVFDVGDAGLVFDPAGDREGGREGEVGGDSDGGVPAVGNEEDAVVIGGPAGVFAFGEAAAFGEVGLDDIDGTAIDEGLKRLAAGEYFAGGDENRRILF